MKCPLCSKETLINFAIVEDVKPIEWGRCICGTIFHEIPIDKRFFGSLYLKKWQVMGADMKERFEYLQRVYLPFIEEATFGRKFLDVGFTLPYTIDYLKARGWICAGIDLVPNDYVKGDFENFAIPETFDYINMGHCLECFNDPIGALKKAYRLLNNDGLLLITHPNPEMIFELGLSRFGHWNYRQNHIFIAKDKLEDIARRIGFDVILSHRNISQRFVMHNDLHLLLQRKE
jgi:SAM-dependent methyltransferase